MLGLLIVLFCCVSQVVVGSARFSGKIVMVTGGSSGMGKEVAKLFAQECADTIHIVSRAEGQLLAAKKEIESVDRSACISAKRNNLYAKLNATVIVHPTDLSNLTQVTEMFSQITDLDAAVNCAGIGGFSGNLADTPAEIWLGSHDAVFNNVYATAYAMQAQVKIFLANNKTKASIVNFSSGQGLVGCQGGALYSASKHAIIGLTQSVALEVATSGIRVNAIAPGLIETPLTWNQGRQFLNPPIQPYQCRDSDGNLITADFTCDEGCACPNVARNDPSVQPMRDGYIAQNPMKRVGEPQEVARVAIFLSSDDASLVTGSVYRADGGQLSQ
eukprot:c19919_g1_i1.p1 GENE.c19919_g1_i1~~c19919_g1_i1.p1  ORF type:complete len:330 (+),score=145.27 c19919_g1_i1:727-1716(+)